MCPTCVTPTSRIAGKGGKNRRRGKNEGDEKRELVVKEEGQGACTYGAESHAARFHM